AAMERGNRLGGLSAVGPHTLSPESVHTAPAFLPIEMGLSLTTPSPAVHMDGPRPRVESVGADDTHRGNSTVCSPAARHVHRVGRLCRDSGTGVALRLDFRFSIPGEAAEDPDSP